jgi:hypothetical protein
MKIHISRPDPINVEFTKYGLKFKIQDLTPPQV